MRCACLSRPSGRVGSNDPLSLSSTESNPTSHAKSQRPSNPNRLPMCATEAIGTQIEIRIDRPIASQCAPPWPSEPRSKAESSNQSLPDVRHRGHRNPDRNQNRSFNRCPTCATVAMGTQTESRIEQPIDSRCAPPWPSDVHHRYHRCPVRNQNRSANRMPTRTENRHRNRSKINAKSIPEGSK